MCQYDSFYISGVTTNIAGSRGAIRAQTPPSVANISSSFVRGTIPPRTPSPAGTVIPTATTWMTGSQPVQLIRANIGQPPRTKCMLKSICLSIFQLKFIH